MTDEAELKAAMDNLAWALANPMETERQITALVAALASPRLAAALISGDEECRLVAVKQRRALAQYLAELTHSVPSHTADDMERALATFTPQQVKREP